MILRMNSGITFDLRAERGPYAFENRTATASNP